MWAAARLIAEEMVAQIRRQGLADAERGFVTQAIHRAVDRFVYGCEPRIVHVWDCGRDGTELEMNQDDMRAALLSPVGFTAVVADVCRELNVDVLLLVEEALGGE